MNKSGFTLIELLATLVVLGIVTGIIVVGVVFDFGQTKDKTEEIFINTIEDAMGMYLNSSQAKGLTYNSKVCTLNKTHGSVDVYKASDITMNDVINSEYSPLLQEDLVNPANKDVACELANKITISVYRDQDYVYYYKINKNEFGCLKTTGYITNLPSGCQA